ncbi:MAG: DEAD/DEAH box helicase [Candidatus Omnitrophica bacterium]|nr:DEAD/DEAH box helicase [Candidatus Omnitrophota bacterium]MBU4479736.1 DEAD/DEAH box helicase [Candidatus Omnitrophota bacterium]
MKEDKKAVKLTPAYKPPELTLEQWQIALRREYARGQKFILKNIGRYPVFSEFTAANPHTKRSYRVAIRSDRLGENFCSCPDFSINTLGTCKHIEFTLARLRKTPRGRAALAKGFLPPFSEIFLRYGLQRQVIFSAGSDAPAELKILAGDYFEDNVLREDAFYRFNAFLEAANRFNDHELRCYDDVLAFIAGIQDAGHRRNRLEKKFPLGVESPLFEQLLKVRLYPYQRQGTLFAAQAGRALIADEMGLGKTIQAIAATEILAREFGMQKVLIICPTSLKYQWKSEIEKFSQRPVCIIEGGFINRRRLYAEDGFYKVVNYDVVYRDIDLITAFSPDMVILDEAQRIKNWRTRTAKSVKQIKSEYALVLTGTPLENRLEELHSIVEFVDRYHLGPTFRFLANHQQIDPESGKVTGYANLKSIGKTLSSILLRRTKKEVLTQLPERMDKTFFVPMTTEQMKVHEENSEIVSKIASKWAKNKFLSEVDHRRLMVALQYMRMACDDTFLIDQTTHSGKKLDELITLLSEIFEDKDVKVVIFSQWERMTSLVGEALRKKRWNFVYLHGGVPGHKRKDLIKALNEDPACRIFLSTDAGGIGLNLQAASVVINMDLPWNPAVLEQRIGRVHRLGQHRPVRAINFVSEKTIEHRMLSVLQFKKSLFAGVLEGGQDSIFIGKSRLKKFMESVEELTGSAPKIDNKLPGKELKEPSKEKAVSMIDESKANQSRELLSAGAALLQALAGNLAGQGVPDWTKFIETDKVTNKSSLKIPLPEKQVIRDMLPAVNSFVEALKRIVEN